MKTILTCLAAGLCAIASAQQSELYLTYIEQYAPMAVQEMHSTGIPASITLAQGLLESGAGTSTLAQSANNHFGIKCHRDWTGNKMYRKDDDRNAHGKLIESCFRSYDNPAQSYSDHSQFLLGSPRYSSLFLLERSDYKGWARGLKEAGYATSHTYATKLIGIVEAYELHKFDEGNFGMPLANAGSIPAATANQNAEFNPAKPVLTGASASITPAAKERSTSIAASSIQVINDVKFTYPQPGEDLGDVARRTRRYSSDLVEYNETLQHSSSPVSPSTRIYLQPKRKTFRGKDRFHRVAKGETMQAIADKYAVQTEALYARNNMPAGTQPRSGEAIQLRGKRKKDDIVGILSKGSLDVRALASNQSPAPRTSQPTQPVTYGKEEAQATTQRIEVIQPSSPASASSSTGISSSASADRTIVASTTPNYSATTTPSELGRPIIIDNTSPLVIEPAKSTTQPKTLIVGNGDTLYGISRRTGVAVEQIKALNGLTSNTIHSGQKLVISR